ncbi:MAG: HAD family hydrolase [Candidatus Marinimicrobia bacterium]|nr:HAD family hydrolase [Candidatus Neomarinimicrobiota bacterium]
MKYRHIIWDWNGTLFNDAWLCVEVMNGVLSRRNMVLLTPDRYMDIFDFPVVDYYRRLGFDFEKEPFQISGTEFIVEYNKRYREPTLHQGARSTLQAVKDAGVTQSILSAQEQSTLDELLDIHNMQPFLLKAIGLNDHYAHSKIENGLAWMKELHYGSHEVLFVGDTVHDHEVAEAIGADCVLIPGGHHSRTKLEKTGVPVLNDLSQLVDWILEK